MNRDLIFVALSLFTWGVGESTFLPFQSLYLQQLGATPFRIGAILGAYGIAATLAHIPAGYLADKIGRRPMMWAAWLFGILATAIMAIAESLPLFVTGMLLYGLTLFVLAPLNSYITAARGKWSIGRALTLISACYNLGTIIGPTLGGIIGHRIGFRGIFSVSAAVFVVSTLFILQISKQPVEEPAEGGNGNALLKNTGYFSFVAVFSLATFAMYLPQPLSPNFLQNERGLDLVRIGQLYSIGGLGIVALNLTLGQLIARKGYLLGQVSVGLFALIVWLGRSFFAYGLAYFWLGGFRASRTLATAHIRSLVLEANMGLAYGLAETATAFTTFLAPLLAGFLYENNPVWIYPVSLGLISISILLNLATMRASSVTAYKQTPNTV
ncbi:MAG TPA: MFS transporter [Anaerolineales bacterium]|nr:MFS transporter [Anaerolineales bacterium]